MTQAQQSAIKKINNTVRDHLTDKDISGSLRDITGNPVPKRAGGFYDHAKEVNEAINGLRRHLKTLEGVDTLEANAARQAALDAIKRVEEALRGAGL